MPMGKISTNKHTSHRRLVASWLTSLVLVGMSSQVNAEPLRIAYTSIAVVYGPLWLTKEAGLFKKYNIEPEFVYIAGGPPSLQALIAGDVTISFTAGGATVAANLQGSDVVLLGASIDALPFELWSIPGIKEVNQLKGTRLGVSRIGATTDFIARYMLKKWNLQPDKDVAIFQTGSGPQIFAALYRAGNAERRDGGICSPCRCFRVRARLSVRPVRRTAGISQEPTGFDDSCHESQCRRHSSI